MGRRFPSNMRQLLLLVSWDANTEIHQWSPSHPCLQVLRQCPQLVSTAFPSIWRNLMESERMLDQQSDLDQLSTSIKLITGSSDHNVKFRFFINGLDEYEGFDRDIASSVKTFASAPSVKVCLASRPHIAFLNIFGSNPGRMFYVHEFTTKDIHQYTKLFWKRIPNSCQEKS